MVSYSHEGVDEQLRGTLRTMANETNLRILRALVKDSTYPSELSRRLGLPRSLVNKRLVLMERLGLLRSEDAVIAHRKVKKYRVISRDLQLSLDVSSLLFEVGSVKDRHLASRLSEDRDDPAYNYLKPHRFGFREAVSAWIARTLGDEKLVKVFFYEDELPRSEHPSFVKGLDLSEYGGRFVKIFRRDSLRDVRRMSWPEGRAGFEEVEVGDKRSLSPSSGFFVCGQGSKEFADRLRKSLVAEKAQRRKDKPRTLVGR